MEVPIDKCFALWKSSSMPRFGDAVRDLIEKAHMTQREFCAKAGISTGTLARVLGMGAATVNQSTYKAIAAAFGMSPFELDRRWRSQNREQQIGHPAGGIPILSECPAGRGDDDPTTVALDNGLGIGYIPRAALPMITDPLAYALIIRGDSMEPDFPDGMTVICSPHATHESGKVYAIRFGSELDDECTIKEVIDVGNGRLVLKPRNAAHKAREVDRRQIVRMDRVVAKIEANL